MFASEKYLFLQGKENPFDSMFVKTFLKKSQMIIDFYQTIFL